MLAKHIQKYFSMIKLGPAGAGKLYDEIMKWEKKPIEGVTLEEAYQVFGEWDFAVLFNADSNDNALHFVGDIVRYIDGVAAVSTVPISPIRNFQTS
jgi:uncharacterized protein with GYD domain